MPVPSSLTAHPARLGPARGLISCNDPVCRSLHYNSTTSGLEICQCATFLCGDVTCYTSANLADTWPPLNHSHSLLMTIDPTSKGAHTAPKPSSSMRGGLGGKHFPPAGCGVGDPTKREKVRYYAMLNPRSHTPQLQPASFANSSASRFNIGKLSMCNMSV